MRRSGSQSVRRFLALGVFLVAVTAWLGLTVVRAQEPDPDALADPLVLGAWLYEGQCTRCHGPYEQDRVASTAIDKDQLIEAIESDGCAIRWGREYGGPLKNSEIKAVALYMLTWEELGEQPDLPELPSQPTPTATPTPLPEGEAASSSRLPTPTPELMDETTRLIVEGNPIAWGAWLYTQHCYRCHRSYASYRQGLDTTQEEIEQIINAGKMTSKMPAFGRKYGGDLKSSEIEAIAHYIVTWEDLGEEPALPGAVLAEPTPNPADFELVQPLDVPRVSGDPKLGAELFAANCVPCHGAGGTGGVGPALVRDWLSVRPDLTVKSTIVQGIPGSLMPAWYENTGGSLTEEEIDALVAYIGLLGNPNKPGTSLSSPPGGLAFTAPVLAALSAGWLLLVLGVTFSRWPRQNPR